MEKDTFYIFSSENFVDLNLYQCGWEKCSSGHSFGPTTRNHYLFHYVVRGKGTLVANGPKGNDNVFHISGGQGFLIFPGQITTYFADKDNPWEYTWLEFDGLKVKEVIALTKMTTETPVYTTTDQKSREALLHEMSYISHNPNESPFNIIGHLYLFMHYLTASCKRDGIIKTTKMSDFYIKEAINFIEQRFMQDISVEDIAKLCDINRSYLTKIFKQSTGKSPKEFLIIYRMSKAQTLLRNTELSVADVGRAVGFNNQLNFSRAFKNFCGVSPSQWRENAKRDCRI
ncbi:AraC family transcriptional regulator [Treponema zioleckii]|uniref:AraC family transcriptional regulator n=1 Tax=Treponema zioleckii TaxID=331680 RepID=UPI00168BA217|nr:AraC family transcriptional regulator [Treponema zioleckii]